MAEPKLATRHTSSQSVGSGTHCIPNTVRPPRSWGGAGGLSPPAGRGAADCKPSSVPLGPPQRGLPPRGDDHPSATAVSRRLRRPTRVTVDEQPTGVATRTLPGLAPNGVYLASRLPGCRWALTPPFHLRRRDRRLCLSVALSLRFPSPGVTRRPALWSSDFPRPVVPAAAICPPPGPIVAFLSGAGQTVSLILARRRGSRPSAGIPEAGGGSDPWVLPQMRLPARCLSRRATRTPLGPSQSEERPAAPPIWMRAGWHAQSRSGSVFGCPAVGPRVPRRQPRTWPREAAER